jgi:hypothetical protein
MPDLQGPADGLVATAVEIDANVSPLTWNDAGIALADTPLDRPPTPALSNHDVAFTGGQSNLDDDITIPLPERNALAHDAHEAAGPEDGGGPLPMAILPALATSIPAVLASPALANPSAEAVGSHVADAGIGDGGTFGALAHVDYPIFHAGLTTAATLNSGGFATAAVAADPATSAPALVALAAPENPAHENSGPITEVGVGAGGATAAQVQQALDESGLNVNGTGIKVGVLSDSFNDLGGAAADEADGALPSASKVQVLEDLASGGTDEGRAMMQVIHDIAPGASLAFYTADNSEQDFANGILALAAAGCKVICDDVSYFDEPFFQNGVIAQAIQTVEAEGVTYVTAAGNNASKGYQAAWTPGSGLFGGLSFSDAELFGGSLAQTITVTASSTEPVPLLLEWNEAYGQANFNSGQAPDIDLYVFHNGELIGQATNASVGEPNNPWTGYEFTASGTYQIVIANNFGPDPGLIKEILAGDGLPVTISGANTGTVVGHALTPGVITAGAVSAADTPAFGFNPASESFSSSGAGAELLFANNGTALSSPDVLNPVAVSSVDDIATTISGNLGDFYGTSAASASLAGVAALMLSANPALTPAQVEQIMKETALPMSNSAVSGAGLVQVDAAVAAAEALIRIVIETFGSTSLLQVAENYDLDSISSGTGPELTRGGAAITVGEYGSWTPIAAEQTTTGYDVAWKLTGADEYTVWSVNSSGSYLSNLIPDVAGNSIALEALETTFQQDLNRDGTIGLVGNAIESFGSTSLLEVGNKYDLESISSGTGPELTRGGAAVTAGEYVGWTLIGAEQVAGGGYDVAWKNASTGQYTVWSTNSNGSYLSNLIPDVAGKSTALESLENTFHQDLNGDGVIGTSATIATGGTLELAAPDSVSVQFNGPTGSLILDHSSAFDGMITGFSGTGSLSSSDQIDLRDIGFGPGTTVAYAGNATGGVLTVRDAQHHTANIELAGNYTGSTFSLSSDGSGGTIVIDPAAKQALASGSVSFSKPGPTDTESVTVSPQNGGAGYVGTFTIDGVTAATGHDSVAWHFNFDSNPGAATVAQSYEVTVADHHADGTNSTTTQSVTVTIAGAGNDAFVFHPGVGADTVVNATSADTIELDGFSSVTSNKQLASLLAEAQAGEPQSLFRTAHNGHDTLINLENHDVITLTNVALSTLHASAFIVH